MNDNLTNINNKLGRAGEPIRIPGEPLKITKPIKQKQNKFIDIFKQDRGISIILLILLVTIPFASYIFIYEPFISSKSSVVMTITAEQQTNIETFKSELIKKAEDTKIPYKLTTKTLAGGYTLGLTTYYPDEPNKLYIDYDIHKPEKKSWWNR